MSQFRQIALCAFLFTWIHSPSRSQDPLPQLAGEENGLENPQLSEHLGKDDPERDDWYTEIFHENVKDQLKGLFRALVEDTPPEPGELDALVESGHQVAPLRPVNVSPVFSDKSVSVWRKEKGRVTEPLGLEAAISGLRADLAGTSDRRCDYKVIKVRLLEDGAETEVKFQIKGRQAEGVVQVNAQWLVRWNLSSPPRIRSIHLEKYEEVRPGKEGQLAFVDVGHSVLGGNESYGQQLAFGYDYWRARSDRRFGYDLAGNHGVAIGDANGDGLDDVYLLQPGGLPNRLFLHQPDGSAREASVSAQLDFLDFSRAALFVDVDNDGDQDLLLGMSPGWLALENDGSGRFTQKGSFPCPGSVYSMAAADYDLDGDLDLFVSGRYPQDAPNEETRLSGIPIPYHDANNGGPSSLWRNEGNWSFREVTQSSGMDVNNRRFTLAAAWEDYDNDGDPDLYVANDFGRNNLFRNDEGYFTDVARELGVEDIGAGMSVSWGDYNNDGWMDLYVGNMYSSAGHRIAFQDRFLADAPEPTRKEFQRHARGNSLFLNHEGKKFEDVTLSAAVNMGRWAWSSLFTDLNNDGLEDLFVANGFITTEDTGDL